MGDLLDHDLARLAWRRRVQRAYDALLPRLALGLAASATVVVVIRLAVPALGWLAWPLAAAGALVPLAWLPRALATRDTPAVLAGHLDRMCGGEGLAMALAEHPAAARDGDWLTRLRRPLEGFTPPALVWRAGRGAALAVVALLAALALPQALPDTRTITPLARLFDQAGARLDALDRNGLLPPTAAEELQQRLAELRTQAGREGMDQTTWEALSRVEHDLAAAGASAAQRLAEALAQAERTATPPAAGTTPTAATDAAQLAAQLAALAAEAPGLVPQLGQGANDAELKQALAAALREAAERGLVTPEQLAALERLGLQPGGEGERLDEAGARALATRLGEELARGAQALGECGSSDALQAALALLRGEALRRGGREGHTDGPGHLARERGPAERIPGAQVAGLPPGARLNPDGSITLAEQMREPDAEQLASATRAAARAFDPAAADARRAATAPRHRAVVERYFAADPASPRPPAPGTR